MHAQLSLCHSTYRPPERSTAPPSPRSYTCATATQYCASYRTTMLEHCPRSCGWCTCHGTAAGAACDLPFDHVDKSFPACTTAQPPPSGTLLKQGIKVEVKYGSTWYKAVITRAHAGDTYNVRYDVDGTTSSNVVRAKIRYFSGGTYDAVDAWCKTDSSGKWGKCSCGQCYRVHHIPCVGGWCGVGGYSQIRQSGVRSRVSEQHPDRAPREAPDSTTAVGCIASNSHTASLDCLCVVFFFLQRVRRITRSMIIPVWPARAEKQMLPGTMLLPRIPSATQRSALPTRRSGLNPSSSSTSLSSPPPFVFSPRPTHSTHQLKLHALLCVFILAMG